VPVQGGGLGGGASGETRWQTLAGPGAGALEGEEGSLERGGGGCGFAGRGWVDYFCRFLFSGGWGGGRCWGWAGGREQSFFLLEDFFGDGLVGGGRRQGGGLTGRERFAEWERMCRTGLKPRLFGDPADRGA